MKTFNRFFGLPVGLVIGALLALGILNVIGLPTASHDDTVVRPNAKGSPAWLMEKHDCWRGVAPADMEGKMPGHVVIRYEGEVSAHYRGKRAVGVALDHVFTKPDPRVAAVYGFCR